MLTKVLAKEFARWQIRVNTIFLSVTPNTPGLQWVLDNAPSAKVFQKAIKKQTFPVYETDIAEAALYLAAEESNSLTGCLLSVNGGVSFPG